MNWAAKLAVGLGTGVPWVMCKQDDAPDPIVSISLFYFSQSHENTTIFTFRDVVKIKGILDI